MELRTETYPLLWISGFLSSMSRYIQIDWISFFSLYMLAVEFLSRIWGCNFHFPDQMVQKNRFAVEFPLNQPPQTNARYIGQNRIYPCSRGRGGGISH